MFTAILSLCLLVLGIIGTAILVTITATVMWYYRGSRAWSFRWHWRNTRLMQLSAIACLFFLAMTASYGVLGEVWTWIYLIAAFKTGTWWVTCYINSRA
jgi:hypothetical protein